MESWIDEGSNKHIIGFRFTSKELDDETGLYYFGARYLDPRTSRWMSVDPALESYVPSPGSDQSQLPGMGGIFNPVNLNLYHYAGNNPLKYTDPTGMAAGDPYETPDAAAEAWTEENLPKTNDDLLERGSTIYEDNGDFYYSEPEVGKPKSVDPSNKPRGTKKEGTIHSHAPVDNESSLPSVIDTIKAFFENLFGNKTYVAAGGNFRTGDSDGKTNIWTFEDGKFERLETKDGE